MKNIRPNLTGRFRKMVQVLAHLAFFALFPLPSFAAGPQVVKGTVTNETGEPLIGVTVQIKGTSYGVVTDIDGKYEIKAKSENILVFSCISFIKQEIHVGDQGVIDVILHDDKLRLDEVVVIGYGTQRKVDITGSVASVGEDAAKERVVMDLGQILAGKVAGVVVSQSSGSPGETSSINIRGNTSLSAKSEPMYVIDGVISTASDVIPSEVQSVDILKDAASTAIYGSEGANGVILITTKKGTANYNKVNLYAMVGFQNVAKTLPVLNARQMAFKNYLGTMSYEFMESGRLLPGNAPGLNEEVNTQGTKFTFIDDEGNFYHLNPHEMSSVYYWGSRRLNGNTDWQKELYDTALLQDYRVSARGGAGGSTYSVMFGNKNQQGTLYGSSYNEYSIRGNFTQKLGKRFHLTFNASYLTSKRDISVVSRDALLGSPMMPIDAGKGYQEFRIPLPPPAPFSNNPRDKEREADNLQFNKAATFNGVLDWNIAKGLDLRLSASYSQRLSETQFFASNNIKTGVSLNGGSYDSYTHNSVAVNHNNTTNTLRTENTLNYHDQIGPHAFSFLLGYSAHTSQTINRASGAAGFSLNNLGIYGMQDGLQAMIPSYQGIDVNGMSGFFRAEYNLMDRYLFKATLRGDGASIFAQNKKWGFFPSAAIGWRMDQENWLKHAGWLNILKLRASYGVSGKQAIQPYQSLATADFIHTSLNGTDYTSALFFNRLGNADLQWERTGEYNVGLDFAVLEDRISLTLDAYARRTDQLLYRDPLPGYTGFAEQVRNIGSIENKGLEANFNLIPYRDRYWEWDLGFNISTNRGKVVRLGIKPDKFIDLDNTWTAAGYLQEGEALGNFWGYTTDGLWQSSKEIKDAIDQGASYVTKNVHPGYPKFIDRDGDHVLTDADKSVIGNAFPLFTGGLTNSLSWKGIALHFTMVFSYGNKIFNATRMTLEGINDMRGQASPDILNAWRPNLWHYDWRTGQRGEIFLEGNKDTDIPIASQERLKEYNAPVPYSNYLEDGSYIRMADLTLSYAFPSGWMRKLRISQTRLFATANNLFVISKYSGYDPEVNCSKGEASFLVPGLDHFPYPKARTFSFGLNVTF